jgi:hypothetical protein
MALIAFDDPAGPPTPEELGAMLGPGARLWAELVAAVRRHAGEMTAERWVFGAKHGWSMRLVLGERILVYLTPQAHQLMVGVVLGEKAIATAEAAGLASERTLEVVAGAPRYAEGRGIRLQVVTDEDLATAIELARVKLGR